MFMAKQKLAIEIAEIDCVEIHDMDLTIASEHKVLKEFTSNASSTNQKNARLHLPRLVNARKRSCPANKPA